MRLFFVLCGVCFLLIACDKISVEEVEKEFRQDKPNAAFITVVPTEGDSDNVYFLISYKEGELDKKEIRLYQKTVIGRWEISAKQ